MLLEGFQGVFKEHRKVHRITESPKGPKTGYDREQNTASILGDCLVCLRFLMYFWVFGGFNYSQMVNLGTRTYSNTFLIIFGTSKMFTKHVPLNPFFITKPLKASLTHLIFTYLNMSKIQHFQIVGNYQRSNQLKPIFRNVICKFWGSKTIFNLYRFK